MAEPKPPRPYGLWTEWRLREEFERGAIAVEEFERELERILRYEASLKGVSR